MAVGRAVDIDDNFSLIYHSFRGSKLDTTQYFYGAALWASHKVHVLLRQRKRPTLQEKLERHYLKHFGLLDVFLTELKYAYTTEANNGGCNLSLLYTCIQCNSNSVLILFYFHFNSIQI